MTAQVTTLPGVADPDDASIHLTLLDVVVAASSAAAGVIHLLEVPAHAGGSMLDPIGFAAFGAVQLLVAGAVIAGRAGKLVRIGAILTSVAALALWIWSRTSGLPFGSHEGIVEGVEPIDAICAGFEGATLLAAAASLFVRERRGASRLGAALLAVATIAGLTLAISWTPAGAGDTPAAAPLSAHDQLMADIDAERCDRDMNIPAYWDEAETVGIDTYQGGAMSADHGAAAPAATAASGDGHAHSHGGDAATAAPAPTTTTIPDPNQGRGSIGLDRLVSLTSNASASEGAAAKLITGLGKADQADYDSWLWWLRTSSALSHDHAAGSGDGSGHGGHVGPQPWVALTDEAQCKQLRLELTEARTVALSYPTAADAMNAGYVRVTRYVPGIAAHYMKFANVDDEFHIAEPEMILYDGDEPTAHVVGLSYYLLHDGDAEPTQGFTGDNDHGHRHIGLCQGKGGVIGDSATTAEECASRGGIKSDGGNGWMSHAWVVPGCESPWGVFSAASPLLDKALSEASGTDDGACAASAVRGRYGLDDQR